MQTQIPAPKQAENKAIQPGKQAAGIVDNSARGIQLKQMAEMIANSAKQMALQRMADRMSGSEQQRTMQRRAEIIQRKEEEDLARHVVQQAQGRVEEPRTMQPVERKIKTESHLQNGAFELPMHQLKPLQRYESGSASNAPIQLMQPHPSDKGRDFQIRPHGSRIVVVGIFLGVSKEGLYIFRTSHGEFHVQHTRIIGYRPTVGLMHPPGKVRPPEDQLEGRDRVFLSEADLSGAMARQRRDPSLLDRMVVTTYEEKPDYPEYEQNRRDLESQGVPILNRMDLSDKEASSRRLQGLGSNPNLHFQMPRVPRIKDYSTPHLIRDTLSLPRTMGRDDMTVSVTTPHPRSYRNTSTHNGFYGTEVKRKFEDTGMELDEAHTDSDSELEAYGYVHKQSTRNQSAEVAKKRKKYKFKVRRKEHSDFKDFPPRRDDEDPGSSGMGGGGGISAPVEVL